MTTDTRSLTDRYATVRDQIASSPAAELQGMVDSGVAWHLEGFVGRQASDLLAAGVLVLAEEARRDYWGGRIPAYTEVRDEVGSPGSVANAEEWWDNHDPDDLI